jgi:four helix bundle protein
MLQIQSFALDTVRQLAPVVRAVAREDPDLARQLRRAASSIVLNIAESQAARDGNARQRLRTALGSARETRAALEVAVAWGHTDHDAKLLDALDRISATLHKLAR